MAAILEGGSVLGVPREQLEETQQVGRGRLGQGHRRWHLGLEKSSRSPGEWSAVLNLSSLVF